MYLYLKKKQKQRGDTDCTNLPHGRKLLLTAGQTDSRRWPAQKPAVNIGTKMLATLLLMVIDEM